MCWEEYSRQKELQACHCPGVKGCMRCSPRQTNTEGWIAEDGTQRALRTRAEAVQAECSVLGSSSFKPREIETQKRTVKSEGHDQTHPWKRLCSPFPGAKIAEGLGSPLERQKKEQADAETSQEEMGREAGCDEAGGAKSHTDF